VQPSPGRAGTVLAGHIVFTLLYSALFANILWLMPLLARLRFGTDDPFWKDWQTTLVTAAIPTVMMTSIFWAELMRRVGLRTYLLVFWFVAAVPLGCVALAQNYWQFLACHLVAAAGFASWSPANGTLLKHFYGDAVRGRVFGLLNAVTQAGSIAAIFALGTWIERDPRAFRIYFPCAAAAQFGGILVLRHLVRLTKAEGHWITERARSWKTLLRPVWNMGAILRTDRTFLRYELAFMTYGAAFMICDALLPVLATDKLGMWYEDFSQSTQMAVKGAMLVVILPMGWVLDRIGAVRTCAISFAALTLYPLFLLLADGPAGVAVASATYGIGLGGVMLGWTLGPVTLAGSADRVPQYIAIHATLVGVRGIVFQSGGMALYKITGDFTWPLGLAALAFLWAAVQMRQLHGAERNARK